MRTIFIADDDDSDRWDLKHLITSIDPSIVVSEFRNGLELMQQLSALRETELPFMLFLDLRMPMWDGIRTLNALQADAKYMAIPVYMWSTADTNNEMDLCLKSGARDFIVKPAKEEEWAAVKYILSKICKPAAEDLNE